MINTIHEDLIQQIAGVVGRADLLCALFCFLSFLAYVQSTKTVTVSTLRCSFHLAQSLIFCALALFSKEQGITIIVSTVISQFIELPTCLRHFLKPVH